MRSAIYNIWRLFSIGMFIIFLFQSCSYLPEQKPPPSDKIQIIETRDYLLLEPYDQSVNIGILFIPGGLVDPHAYLQTFIPFVSELKMNVLILKVRSNLAILNRKQADKVIIEFNTTRWLIGGHSLGGVVASMTVENNRHQYEGLFLMGSYSNVDISNWDQPVFSFLAELDGLTERTDVNTYASLLPDGIHVESLEELDLGDSHGKTIYYTIQGGNHSQFGNYGLQKGDGMATISGEEQKEEFFQALTQLMRNNGFEL